MLLAVLRGWAQDVGTTWTAPDLENETQMLTPPPVSGEVYSKLVGAEMRSNYLRTGLVFSTGYIHNLEAGTTPAPINDKTYLVQPTISFDGTNSRIHEAFTYNPGFAFYQPTSVLNRVDQVVSEDFSLRLTPHVALRAADSFEKTSTAFGLNSTASQGISGSTQLVTPGVVAPFAPENANRLTSEISWQFSDADMVGASGLLTKLDFTDPSEASGFYNSNMSGGSAAWAHRVTGQQYLGLLYQYARIEATTVGSGGVAAGSETRSHNGLGFYTVYFRPNLSLSLVGGAQYYDLTAQPAQPVFAWSPVGMASLDWQGNHASFAANFARIVTGGYGVVGAFETNSANATARWQMSRTWTADLSGTYSRISNVDPQLIAGSFRGGNTAAGTVSIEHAMGTRLALMCTYTHLRQTYAGITALSANPESDSVVISLSYRFSKPIGR